MTDYELGRAALMIGDDYNVALAAPSITLSLRLYRRGSAITGQVGKVDATKLDGFDDPILHYANY